MIDHVSLDTTERAVLFAATQNQGMLATLLAQADVEWFLSGNHRRLFSALKSCFESGSKVDSAMIFRAARTQANAQFGEVILDAEWLAAGRSEVKGMTMATFTEEHLPFVREAFQLRKLHEFFSTGLDRLVNENSGKVLAWASGEITKVSALGSSYGALKVADALLDQYERPRSTENDVARRGPYTRMRSLDAVGFRLNPNEPITIAGKPGHGKTIISSQIAIGASTQCGVAVLPVEDGHEQWLNRYSIMIQGKTVDDLRDVDGDDYAHGNFTSYCQRIKDRPLYVAKNCVGMTSFEAIAFLQRLKAEDPTLGVVIIDQIYRLGDYGRREIKGESQTEAITRQLSRLAEACVELGICLVMLQHVKKDMVGDPQLSDISDSYIFERLSRKIILINRPSYESPTDDDQVNVKFAKWTMSAKHDLTLDFRGERFQIDGFTDPAVAHLTPAR
jgi:replicative DNA helicase